MAEEYDGQGPDAADFPHLDAYRQIKGLATITEAAGRVLELATAWGRANAGLELVRANASAAIMAADSVEAVDAAFDGGFGQAAGIVAQVLASGA